MKLILTAAVNKVGVAGDIVDVKPGYGRNFLLPQGYAISWSKGAEKQILGIQRARDAREIRSSRRSASRSPLVQAPMTASCTAPSPRPMSWPL